LALSEADLQHDLDRRRPGQSRHTTQRREADAVRILSGVFEGRTTGAPIGLLIENQDQRSKDYSDIADRFRPGHADYSYTMKYGFRDYRGGGRSSARETAIRVAGGGIAKVCLRELAGVTVRGFLSRLGPIDAATLHSDGFDWDETDRNPFFCPVAARVAELEAYMDELRKSGDSIGAEVTVVADGVPPGLGEPVFDRLDADIAHALMGINAVKGVEVGAGFASVAQKGTEHRDEMTPEGFLGNNAGGVLGGISTGQASSPGSRSSPPAASGCRAAPWTWTASRPRSSPRAATTPASASARRPSPRPCFEVTTLRTLGRDSHRYALVRLWGSIGFIVAVVALGWLLDRVALAWLPWIVLALLLVLYLATLQVREPQDGHPAGDGPIRLFSVLRRPEVIALLAACFFMQASHGPYYAFFTLYVEGQGFSRAMAGQLWALGVAAEVLLFLVMPQLILRFGSWHLIAAALALTTLRWWLLATVPESLPALLFIQTLHAASYGVYHAAAIALVHVYFPGRLQGRGQALYSSLSFGLGGAVGALGSGYLWDGVSPGSVYLFAAFLAAIGFVVALAGVLRTRLA
jgi:chorismate synthase